MKWEKIETTINKDGRTIVYQATGTRITIESRKRHIPHANGVGTWEHTSYFVIADGKELVEKWSLKDAKEYAEKISANDQEGEQSA